MAKFKIKYTDPETGEEEVVKDFEDTPTVSAREWAEDYAYTLADKGHYEIEEVKENKTIEIISE